MRTLRVFFNCAIFVCYRKGRWNASLRNVQETRAVGGYSTRAKMVGAVVFAKVSKDTDS